MMMIDEYGLPNVRSGLGGYRTMNRVYTLSIIGVGGAKRVWSYVDRSQQVGCVALILV